MMEDATEILRQQGVMEADRSNFESQWQDVAEHVLPRQADFSTGGYSRTQGMRRTTRIYDETAMLALDPQWLGADRAAIRGFAGLAGPYDFLPLKGDVVERTFGAWPRADETQPIHYAVAGSPPTLLLHGGEDGTVWPKNSINLSRRLKAAGAESELKIYPRTGHVGIVTGLAKPFRGDVPVLKDVAAFAHRLTAK